MFGKLWKEDTNIQQLSPQNQQKKKAYENNAKDANALLGILLELEFFKVMQMNTTNEICDKIIQSYEGYSHVKHAKLQTLIIQYETLKMQSDENIARYILRVDEIVNCMNKLGEEIKEATIVEKTLRSLS